jgi:hypothetical protein
MPKGVIPLLLFGLWFTIGAVWMWAIGDRVFAGLAAVYIVITLGGAAYLWRQGSGHG